MIAPALIPRRAADRIKTDRRDAGQLALLYRAGALTTFHIPTDQEEGARDLATAAMRSRPAQLLKARLTSLPRFRHLPVAVTEGSLAENSIKLGFGSGPIAAATRAGIQSLLDARLAR